MEFLRKNLAVLFGALLTMPLMAAYSELFKYGHLLATDDHLLVDPLIALFREHGFTGAIFHYWGARGQGLIQDLQPLRDLSYLLDIALNAMVRGQDSTPYPWMLGSQCAISLTFIWGAWRLLKLLAPSSPPVALLIALAWVATHPVLHGATSWIAGRKHLLAATPITWASVHAIAFCHVSTNGSRSGRRSAVAASILYGAAMLTQPLAVLWPIWFAIYSRANREALKKIALPTGAIAIAVLTSQWMYYGSSAASGYVSKTGVAKIQGIWSPLQLLEAISRYTLNLFAPFELGFRYSPGDPSNLWGALIFLAAMASLLLLSRREPGAAFKKFGVYLLFVPILLAPVLLVKTGIFVLDTYLVYALPFVAVCIAAKQFNGLARGLGVAAILAAHCWASLPVIASFKGDSELWSRAYKAVPTIENLETLTRNLMNEGQIGAAFKNLKDLQTAAPSTYAELYPRAVYQAGWLAPTEKIPLLDQLTPKTAWSLYYSGALKAGMGQFKWAWGDLQEAATLGAETWGESLEVIAAEAEWICQRAEGTTTAPAQIPGTCSAMIKSLKNAASLRPRTPSWNQQRYLSRHAQLVPN